MRPEALNPLFAEVRTLDGVGPKLLKPLEKLGLARVKDVAYHLPERFVSRRAIADLDEGAEGEQVIVALTPVEHRSPRAGGRGPYRVLAQDAKGNICALTWFGKAAYTARKLLPVGERRWIAGRLDRYGDMLQIVHPDHIEVESAANMGRLSEPVYRLSEGLTQPRVAGLVEQALARLPELPEWIEPGQLERSGWPAWRDALRRGHETTDEKVRDRLAYDELLANSLALLLVKAEGRRRKGQALVGDGALRAKLQLPFALTGAQKRSIAEIEGDMAQEAPMLRLLQGDVGSGKTLVAALAMAYAAEAGLQSALMAPTDLLARQHAANLIPLLESAGLRAAVLTGRDKASTRREILAGLESGAIHVVIGTHALFQEAVTFRDLGLIVIDEQHRFGVSDRMKLVEKGYAPHVLVMSATPIPRTLALSVHGDMDISVLDEKPPGRQPIRTVAMQATRADEVAERIAEAAAKGERAYWVCPLIEESEAVDLAAVQDRYEILRDRFGDAVEIVHGRMAPSAREAAMERFRSGEAFLLVATTVIEVGVDVPQASIMVIEHAERFGLAQLHQLRGRVGRGGLPGYCILLWRGPLGEAAKERLDVMRRTDDGFVIAETDYKLRGFGDVLGVQQSGMPAFKLVDWEVHGEMLGSADKEARLAVDRDPTLEFERGRAIAMALELFGYAEAAQLARSG